MVWIRYWGMHVMCPHVTIYIIVISAWIKQNLVSNQSLLVGVKISLHYVCLIIYSTYVVHLCVCVCARVCVRACLCVFCFNVTMLKT